MEYHKGKIEVESVEKEGSRFKVYFPAGKNHFEENQIKHIKKGLVQQTVAVATEADAYDSKEDIVGEKSKKSILIVEDNVELRDYLKKELNSSFTVYEAGNGKIGLEMSKLRAPDVIITDVMMPEMDGIEACEKLRAIPELSQSIITFLTARGEDYSQLAGFEAGADDYITKPVKPKVLVSKVKALLRRFRESEEAPKNLKLGNLVINREEYKVIKDKKEMLLPRKEFELVALLA